MYTRNGKEHRILYEKHYSLGASVEEAALDSAPVEVAPETADEAPEATDDAPLVADSTAELTADSTAEVTDSTAEVA